MKQHPDFLRAADLVKEVADAARSDDTGSGPHRLDGPPETAAERAEAREALSKLLDAGKVRFLCVGCGDDLLLDDTIGCCACGGFVCAACQRIEEDGVCDHEPLVLPPEADDDDED